MRTAGESPADSRLGLREALSLRTSWDQRQGDQPFSVQSNTAAEDRAMRGEPEPRRINDAIFGGQVKCDYQVSCTLLVTNLATDQSTDWEVVNFTCRCLLPMA